MKTTVLILGGIEIDIEIEYDEYMENHFYNILDISYDNGNSTLELTDKVEKEFIKIINSFIENGSITRNGDRSYFDINKDENIII